MELLGDAPISLSIRQFLGLKLTDHSPDHSSLTIIRERLPDTVHESVFEWVLGLASEKKLLGGKTVAVDSTTLEAHAAMKGIICRDAGEDWRSYVICLMRAEGVMKDNELPSDEVIRRFDRKRRRKKYPPRLSTRTRSRSQNRKDERWNNPLGI